MSNWRLLVTRETVLLERYLRVESYQKMFGLSSKVRVNNLLIINKNVLTSQFVYTPELEERFNLLWIEYNKKCFKKLVPFWNDILKNLKKSTGFVLSKGTSKNFKIFIKWYKLARAIVFYTNDLSKILESKNLLRHTSGVAKWHEKSEIASSAAWDTILPFFEHVSREYNISSKKLLFYLPNEFFRLLLNGEKVKEQILDKRIKYYVLWLKNGQIKLYTDKTAHKIEETQLPLEKNIKIKEINGVVACKGKVIGKVRIVNTQSQLEKMQIGEVLISVMTTPRLLPAVKKAIAIITDEGGITCHAAIVSREFGIPCIIGTKNATKIFKNGDLVEVDATSGTVKIVKTIT
ncbi:MAG: Pyruvate, water dikinase [uncultured bacterium]|nr:MAG: Pyruvate, water dikinase [uncultured bacterium]